MTLPEKFAARVLSELGPEEGAALCAAGLCGYLGFLQAHNGKEGPEDELD